MRKRGRPKAKKLDFKKPFPMRFSDRELKLFKLAVGDQPLREWMRETLVKSVIDQVATHRNPALSRQVVEFLGADNADFLAERQRQPQLP